MQIYEFHISKITANPLNTAVQIYEFHISKITANPLNNMNASSEWLAALGLIVLTKELDKTKKLIGFLQVHYIFNFPFCTGMSPSLSVGNSTGHSLGVLLFLECLCSHRWHHRTCHGVWMKTECFVSRQIWAHCHLSSLWISYWNLNQKRYRVLNNVSLHCVSSTSNTES